MLELAGPWTPHLCLPVHGVTIPRVLMAKGKGSGGAQHRWVGLWERLARGSEAARGPTTLGSKGTSTHLPCTVILGQAASPEGSTRLGGGAGPGISGQEDSSAWLCSSISNPCHSHVASMWQYLCPCFGGLCVRL